MQYIGEGFYYRVYEYDSNRVFKKILSPYTSFKKIYNFVRSRRNESFVSAFFIACRATRNERKELRIMKKQLESVPGELFANPLFVKNGLSYTQDKVTTIGDLFKRGGDGYQVIDKYIGLQKKLWAHSMHDAVYKLQLNYGVDQNGNVVCIDFGEFLFTKEQAIENIKKKKWLSRESYKQWENKELKEYYTDRMAETMTEAMVEKFWAKDK